MFFRRSVTFIALQAILISMVIAPSAHVVCPGDVNGDQETNILDIQLVAAALTSEDKSPQTADLNRDGKVDILDFQQLIAETSDPKSAQEDPQPDQHQAILHSACEPVITGQASMQVEALRLASQEPPAPGLITFVDVPAAPPKTVRHRCGYAPHAPPLAA